jgi:putative heme-binding domain-containing protein
VELALLIGSSPKSQDAIQMLVAISKSSVTSETRFAVLPALGEGLRRRGTSLANLLTEARDQKLNLSLEKIFQQASENAVDTSLDEAVRVAAISVMADADSDLVVRTLPRLFTPQTSPTLQLAAVKALSRSHAPESIALLLNPWKGFGPATRREVIDQLVGSAAGATGLIKAVKEGEIKIGDIERDKRQLLLNHPNPAVREAARSVLADPPSNRKQVVADYQPALELTGDFERGKALYAKTCIQCHRSGSNGHQVGPDLTSVQNKSAADLLIAILDPNREAQPSFQTYTAITKQGTVHAGIISTETTSSLTLKRAEAKEDVVLREAIDELVATGQSLMPEGLEKDISQQALADLIAFIKSQPAITK